MSIYDERPWLKLYPEGLPTDLEPEFTNALAMFRATAGAHPDKPAYLYFDATITFKELDELTDSLAAALQDKGFEPGDRLAVYTQNVPQFAMAMLATWKAGGMMVSINPMLRHKEVNGLLNDSGAKALVTLEQLWDDVAKEVAPNTSVETVITTSELDFNDETPELLTNSKRSRDDSTEDLLELAERFKGQQPKETGELKPDDVAFLVYTSGTTGPPKGAMNTHENVVFNSQTYREWVPITEDDVILGVAPLFHITGLVAHLTLGWLTGTPVVLFYRFDPDDALARIERHKATFTVASITVFIALMNAKTFEQRDVSLFKKLLSGGAPIAQPTVDAFERQFGTYIRNVYGLTETTSPSHGVPRDARAPVDPESGALSVGTPTFNTIVRIIDEDGNEAEPGNIGEIVTAGPQVVPGYWNNPAETENAMPDGALRTGDVGFMDKDGWFYIVDRKKDMINASGYKVWPREVEDVLYAHDAVREAAVVGVPHEYRGETVKAFVSLKQGQSVNEQELIAFCKERMAAYKYPREIDFVDELPKTASGKVLRRELRDEATKATS
ncbi:MAG: long-chain fatty acid--CoA ligase [Actinomycetota bacterium]|nr:long-chain fatty acid--CoA ligase [Actinomycetota bacterium]